MGSGRDREKLERHDWSKSIHTHNNVNAVSAYIKHRFESSL